MQEVLRRACINTHAVPERPCRLLLLYAAVVCRGAVCFGMCMYAWCRPSLRRRCAGRSRTTVCACGGRGARRQMDRRLHVHPPLQHVRPGHTATDVPAGARFMRSLRGQGCGVSAPPCAARATRCRPCGPQVGDSRDRPRAGLRQGRRPLQGRHVSSAGCPPGPGPGGRAASTAHVPHTHAGVSLGTTTCAAESGPPACGLRMSRVVESAVECSG